ncbi:MAG: hypothetical protein K2W96_14035 [Gemmataceae bacterium]|nr:hypothetical protein [Gemmataceae bacterium]
MRWELPEEIGWLRFSPSGLLLATTRDYGDESPGNFLRLWVALLGTELARLEDIGRVASLSFVAERKVLLVSMDLPTPRGVRDRGLLWDAGSGKSRILWGKDDRSLFAATATPDGRTLVLAFGSVIEVREPCGT